MKLLITAVFGLVLLTGASGPGPLKDSMGNFFTSKDEVALMRGEVADLRHGQKDVWYVFTLSEDGQTIAKVE